MYEEDAAIQGFIGLSGAIEGIFVCAGKNNRRAGKRLLDFVKDRRMNCARMYTENGRPLRFYQKESTFAVYAKAWTKMAGETDDTMRWRRA